MRLSSRPALPVKVFFPSSISHWSDGHFPCLHLPLWTAVLPGIEGKAGSDVFTDWCPLPEQNRCLWHQWALLGCSRGLHQVIFRREVTSSVQMTRKSTLFTNSDHLGLGALTVNREPGFPYFTVSHPLNRPRRWNGMRIHRESWPILCPVWPLVICDLEQDTVSLGLNIFLNLV